MAHKEELPTNLKRKSDAFFKDEFAKGRIDLHLNKARHNLEIAQAMILLSESLDAKAVLKVSSTLEAYDWVISASYYAMYQSALAAIAKEGYVSKTHSSTIAALAYFYVRKKQLEKEQIKSLHEGKSLEEKYVHDLKGVKQKREDANYDVTIDFKKGQAVDIFSKAQQFVNRLAILCKGS